MTVKIIRIHEKPPPQSTVLPGFEPIDVGKDATPRERFEAFHAANPWVYAELVHSARVLVAHQKRRGRTPKIGIRLLVERVRWEWETRTISEDEFKINDHHCPYYARLIMANEEDLADVFETRTIRATS